MENNLNTQNKVRFGISASTLAIIAMITMFIDHCGYILFDNAVEMRIIGRIAFPIYAFMLVEGYYKTSNKVKYFLRLFIMAIVTEPLYDSLFLGGITNFSNQNILFELSFGILLLHSVNKLKEATINFKTSKYILYTILIGGILVGSELLNFDYGAIGLIMILIFSLGYNTKFKWITTILGIAIPYVFLFRGYRILDILNIFGFKLCIYMQTYAVLAIPFLLLYNGTKGISNKTFKTYKYIFYPLHIALLLLIKTIGG